ncbi:hypothetical protein TWF506_010444 [Arthrobotrys conoides]|uniref:VWFA domain-containing protein n=1 Tax=Arthrobotrys conoides TaxID=74498 RepID=A0AAN8RVD5_9PEZI
MPEPILKKRRSQEHLEHDFAQALKVQNFQGFIKTHVANYKRRDLKKLQDLYKSAESEEEYKEMIGRLADKLTKRVEGDFPKTFEQTVDIVEKEEKEIVKERQKQNRSNSGPADSSIEAPSIDPNPIAPRNSGDQESVPLGSTGQQDPAKQPVSPNAGSSSGTAGNDDPQIPPNKLPRNDTMSTKVESVFSNDGKSSKSSETSAGSSIQGNNGALEPDITYNLPPQEELEQEYAAYAEDFIRRNFKGLLDPNSPDFKNMMRNAARKAKEIMEKYDITPEDAKKLTKLALYDFAILCDDSSSMISEYNDEGEDRITPMKDTLGRISEIATIIEPSGISLRFLNHDDESGDWDNMKSREVIYDRFAKVEEDWGGWTPLGTILDQKIIQPMVIDKMRSEKFVKPLIVVVITDGQPCGEADDAFKNAVIECKRSREVVGYGEAAVIFIISRVGSDKGARTFLSGLKRNKELREWVYCNMDRLDDNSAIMQRAAMVGEAQGDKEYAKKLLQVFLAALGQQTK